MSEVYEHNKGDHEDPMPGPTWLVGFIGTVMCIVIVLGVSALLRMTQQETFEDISLSEVPEELRNHREAQADRLSADPHYEEYIDANGALQQRLVIPLDDAMQIVADESRGR